MDNPDTLATLDTQDKDNPDTLATLDTQDTGRRQTKHKNTAQKTKTMSNTDLTKTGSELRCSQRVRSDCFLYDTRRVSPIKVLSAIE